MHTHKTLWFLALLVLLTSCSQLQRNQYESQWQEAPDGVWTGSGLWANRLQDWKIENSELHCESALPMRTVHLLHLRLEHPREALYSSLHLRNKHRNGEGTATAGILLGAGGDMDYRAASLIHHAPGPSAGLYVGITTEGSLFVRDFEQSDAWLLQSDKPLKAWQEAFLTIQSKELEEGQTSLLIRAIDPSTSQLISKAEVDIPSNRLIGNLALVADSKGLSDTSHPCSFIAWEVRGDAVKVYPQRNTGPLVSAMYTLSKNTLKISCQLQPLGAGDLSEAELYLDTGEGFIKAGSTGIETPSYTGLFRIEDWKYPEDIPFRIQYSVTRKRKQSYQLEGIIKHDPHEKDSLTLLSLSCIEQVVKPDRRNWTGVDGNWFPWNTHVLYPHTSLVEHLQAHQADVLFFAGDQVYEGASPTRADLQHPYLDYLYKWYLWCLSYKPLLLEVPSISIPDDHDVYHGNLWGAGGRATPEGLQGAAAQDAGGYKMPADFVNMVQTTQTRHLPDPWTSGTVEQGIGVYYTDCNIGGLSLAILEDRKFKAAPAALLPQAEIQNGWPQNPAFNARYQSQVPDATLLGEEQLQFLEAWAADWSGQSWMKAVLSQTLFANLATLPDSAGNDGIVPYLSIPDSGEYVRGDRMVADFDANGWPQEGRNRALRKFRKAFATHFCGDQHLGSTLQYGIDSWKDAGYAICSPATGNIFPRRWWPPQAGRNRQEGAPDYTGDFRDGFNNYISVYAVANPHKTSLEPRAHHELATGYSLGRFYKADRSIKLENWPWWADPAIDRPFPGWPVRFRQTDNYQIRNRTFLPPLKISGLEDPVVQIIRESSGEMMYSLRISGSEYQPMANGFGIFTVRIGEPDKNEWQVFEGINATSFANRNSLEVEF